MSSLSAPVTSLDLPVIEEVRRLLRMDIERDPNLYDEIDIQRIEEDPTWVQRFLLRKHGDVQAAGALLKASLQFRKVLAIPTTRDQDFPEELYNIGGIFQYEPDRFGNATIYVRMKLHRRVPEVGDLIRSFFIRTFDRVDVETNGRGIALIYDLTGAGFVNADLEMALFLITTLQNYCPAGISYILIYNLPTLLASIWKLVFSWIPGELKHLFRLADERTIGDFVDRSALPDFMGGTATRDYRKPPAGCIDVHEAARRRNISETRLSGLFDLYHILAEKGTGGGGGTKGGRTSSPGKGGNRSKFSLKRSN